MYTSLNKTFTSPFNVVTAFQNNNIDVAVAWEPFASQIRESVSGKRTTYEIRDPTLYQQQILIVANRQALVKNRNGIIAFLEGMTRACQYIEANRRAAAERLESFFKFRPGFLADSAPWKATHFSFSADGPALRAALQADFSLVRDSGVKSDLTPAMLNDSVIAI